MESVQRSSKVFEDDDDDDEEFGKREELSVKFDRSSDHKASSSTPRSKHSATEQRRRSKINDRFQILRGLLPNSDQKRDKASFLLEVIEYIRFLHEKLQKYESMYPGWIDERAKFIPWNNHQVSGDNISDAQIVKNGSTPGFVVSDNGITMTPAMISSSLNPTESVLIAGTSYKSLENTSSFTNKVAASSASLHPILYTLGRGTDLCQSQQALIGEADNAASHSHWLQPSSPGDCTISNDMLHEREELTIDEGLISVSCAYSQELLNNLSEALENSGVDLSQSSISVQINLGRRASGRQPNTSISMATAKDNDDHLSGNFVIGPGRIGSRADDESEAAAKRHKSNHR